MTKYLLLLFIISIISLNGFTQEITYPYKIKKGEKQTFENKEFDVWILKESQFDRALADSKQLDISRNLVEELENKIKALEEKDIEKDGLIETLKKDRDHYMGIWKETDKDLTELAKITKKEIRKKRLYRTTTLIGAAVIVLLLL